MSNTIPHDVTIAMAIRFIGIPVGKEMYDKVKQTIKDYPEYFPWEHKWESIPQYVHIEYLEALSKAADRNAKRLEKKRNKETKANKDYKVGGGLTLDLLKETIQDLFYEEERARKEKKAWKVIDKKLWNKYYKQYKLEYRE